ncbi:MAG: ribonuclease III [Lachnospiraceae bacterium]|nr:ribonuclease III [Lachnospiraceae bacterium]
MPDLNELEKRIGYSFKNRAFLKLALTHSSYVNENHLGKHDHNERIEFLGDAVLELVSSEFFYRTMPDAPEGDMTQLRAAMVCEVTLASCAKSFGLGEFLMMSRGEELTGGREKDSLVSDAFESLIGAVYLDGGLEEARKLIHRFVLTDIEHKRLFYDSKSILQVYLQEKHIENFEYVVLDESGPAHDKSFTIAARIGDVTYGEGTGKTKKAAQQKAAYETLIKLRSE